MEGGAGTGGERRGGSRSRDGGERRGGSRSREGQSKPRKIKLSILCLRQTVTSFSDLQPAFVTCSTKSFPLTPFARSHYRSQRPGNEATDASIAVLYCLHRLGIVSRPLKVMEKIHTAIE